MPNSLPQDNYYIRIGKTSYPVRLMLGPIGYYGEWYCPICEQARNAEHKPDERAARAAVLLQVNAHHATDHND